MDDKNTSFFRFEDLRVYNKAVEYGKWVLNHVQETKNENSKTLSTSFIHSAFDIALNIAEGSSYDRSQFQHYLRISKTAIRECVVYTALAEERELLTADEVVESRESLMEMTRMVGALIISLQRGGRNRHSSDSTADETKDGLDYEALDIEG